MKVSWGPVERRLVVGAFLVLGCAVALLIPSSGEWYEMSLLLMALLTTGNLVVRLVSYVGWARRSRRSKEGGEEPEGNDHRPTPLPPSVVARADQVRQRLAPGMDQHP